MIKRINTREYAEGKHLTMNEPFILNTKAWDIPNTISMMIRTLPSQCIGISLRGIAGGHVMMVRAEREARKKGVRIFWIKSYKENSDYGNT